MYVGAGVYVIYVHMYVHVHIYACWSRVPPPRKSDRRCQYVRVSCVCAGPASGLAADCLQQAIFRHAARELVMSTHAPSCLDMITKRGQQLKCCMQSLRRVGRGSKEGLPYSPWCGGTSFGACVPGKEIIIFQLPFWTCPCRNNGVDSPIQLVRPLQPAHIPDTSDRNLFSVRPPYQFYASCRKPLNRSPDRKQ